DATIWDRFRSFLKGDDTITDALNRLGLDEEEKEYYKGEIAEGKYLLFVDKEYGSFENLSDQFQPISEEQRERKRKLESSEELPDFIKKDIGIEEEKTWSKDYPHDIPQTVDYDIKDKM